jgi:hypothetical protein
MFALSEHVWNPMASSSEKACLETRTVPGKALPEHIDFQGVVAGHYNITSQIELVTSVMQQCIAWCIVGDMGAWLGLWLVWGVVVMVFG